MSKHTENAPLLPHSPSSHSMNSYNHNDEDDLESHPHREASVNDFDQVDSWGMLHESVGNSLGKFSHTNDTAFLDHRPTLKSIKQSRNRVPVAVKSKDSTDTNSANSNIRTGSDHKSASKTKLQEFYNDSRSANLSPSEFEERFLRLEHLHTAYGDNSNSNTNNNRRRTIANGDVVIDVDALMQSVKKDKSSAHANLTSKQSASIIHSTPVSDQEELNSRPSSRRSSNDSSLDDVCLFLDDEDQTGSKVWPDVEVLEEFSKEETERLRRQAIEDAEEFHFNYDEEDENDEESTADGIFFSRPIVTSIDVPELGNRRVNETENIKDGRLRPKRLTPWHLKRASLQNRSRKTSLKVDDMSTHSNDMLESFLGSHNIQYPPHIISNNPDHFRFTYFRVDLESTVHSPTISGLLQSGQKHEDLFVGSCYSNQQSNTSRRSATPVGNKSSSSQNQLQPQMYKTISRMSSSLPSEEEVSPFWLDVLNPTEEEMKVLSKAFGIHPLTTEDIFLGEAREKVELFKDYYLVCFRSFDIVAERDTRKKKGKQGQDLSSSAILEHDNLYKTLTKDKPSRIDKWLPSFLKRRRRSSAFKTATTSSASSSFIRRKHDREKEEKEKYKRKSGDRHKPREGELEPLNVYIIVFRTGVLTFHFAPTPHPINVRRRARILKDYLNVTSDWIAYALIDDITDAFAPMIELIEDEVYEIEDAILKMNRKSDSSDSDSSDSDSSDSEGMLLGPIRGSRRGGDYESIVYDKHERRRGMLRRRSTFNGSSSRSSSLSSKSNSTGYSTFNANIIGWKRKGDMLRRIGECRKRVMSILRLLGSKADVIKGFSKRCNEQWDVAPRSEIGMYLGDIQDHIITMVSSLNHYEKLLSRSHSNYLAQINIDMTKVNNDMNDVLGKITILGAVVLPMNVITGLWGMNVLVPGQSNGSLVWFLSILSFMLVFAYSAFIYTRKRFDF